MVPAAFVGAALSRGLLTAGLLAGLVCSPVRADFSSHFSTPGVIDHEAEGLQGLHLSRAAGDQFPVGISLDAAGQFAWGMGLDMTMDYSYPGTSPTPPDLVLAYSCLTHADNLRLRADDARMMLGPMIGHPMRPFQLDIETDYRNSGLCVGTSGWETSILLRNQESPRTQRTSLNFNNLWSWGTDRGSNGGGDLYLWSFAQAGPVLQFSPAGGMGFFGSPPVARPVVSGSWSDGSAGRSMLAALVSLGLATDGTVP